MGGGGGGKNRECLREMEAGNKRDGRRGRVRV